MGQSNHPVELLDVANAKLAKVQRVLWRLEERVDDVRQSLEAVHEGLAASMPGRVPIPTRPVDDEALLSRLAERGVGAVRVHRYGDRVELHLDGGAPIRITPALADLVQILIEDRGGTGPLVDWKPLDDIVAALEEVTGRPTSRHAVSQLLSRLAKCLHAAKDNRFLVQRSRGRGARFAVRRAIAAELPPPAADDG